MKNLYNYVGCDNVNGLLCINKEKGMTSFDVVRNIQRKLKVKAGHSGTLDPNATGVLVVAINKATKSLQFLGLEDKVYHATLTFGIQTDTGDIWGETLKSESPIVLDEETLHKVLKSMVKKQKQRVPNVSAKKIDGKKLYEYHRENQPIETQYTDIEIYRVELTEINENAISFRAHVSNGTYIRTLCEDIAEKLGTVGTMSALTREKVGKFSIDECITLDEINENTPLISVLDAISLPTIHSDAFNIPIMHGKRITLDDFTGDLVLLDGGEYFAVYKREKENTFKSVRGLW